MRGSSSWRVMLSSGVKSAALVFFNFAERFFGGFGQQGQKEHKSAQHMQGPEMSPLSTPPFTPALIAAGFKPPSSILTARFFFFGLSLPPQAPQDTAPMIAPTTTIPPTANTHIHGKAPPADSVPALLTASTVEERTVGAAGVVGGDGISGALGAAEVSG